MEKVSDKELQARLQKEILEASEKKRQLEESQDSRCPEQVPHRFGGAKGYRSL
jgi:hypothetical protein